MNKQNVSLVLLEKLVGETKRILAENNSLRENIDLRTDEAAYYNYTTEMAKVSGLLAAITGECKLLGGDVLTSLRTALMPDQSERDDFNDLLNFGPTGNTGGSNLGN